MRTRPNTPLRRMRRPGIFNDGMRPSLSLDFLSGVLDSRITFARSTSGTYYSNGIVTTASANVPRFQSNPVTGASEGLLIEQGITNLVCGSQTFATSGGANNWADTNIVRDGTLRTSPDGTANALRVAASAGNATILNNLSLTSAARTFSVWLRRVTGTGNIELTMDGGTGWTAQTISATWTRCFITATTTAHVGIRIVDSGDEIELWGAQVEALAFATSYIPTTVATVARGADSAVMTGNDFSSWYNPSEGTVLAQWRQANPAGNEFAPAARFALATGIVNSFWIGKQLNASAGRRIEFEMRDASGTQRAVSVANPVTNTVITAAGAQKFGDTFGMSYNGVATVSTAQTRTPAPDRLFVGSYDLTSGHINSTISRLAYWPTRLPDATLQSLTT